MTARLFAVALWLTAGHLVLFGLYWLLLAIPESNIAMLAASLLSVVVMALLFAWVEAVGLLAWQPDGRASDLPRRGLRAMPGVWLGAALLLATWALVGYASDVWGGRRGEIDAWLMVQFGSANTGTLHAAIGWLLAFVRLVGFSAAVSLSAAYAAEGFGAMRSARWVRDGFSPKRLLMLAAILLVCVWLPWRGVNWRPARLAPNWQETAFVAVKLGGIYLLANIGWALVLGAAARGREVLEKAPSKDHETVI